MSKTIIHIGAGKTGTSSLQENIFARLPEIDCLWRPNNITEDCRNFSLGIRLAEDYQLEMMCRPFVERVHSSSKETIVLSDETIRTHVDSLAAARLARYFPDAHILITIRNQYTVLPSCFHHTGRQMKRSPVAGRNLFVTWDEFINYALEQHQRSVAREFKYYDLAKAYAQKFENVSILAFEDMIDSPQEYFGKLASLLNQELEAILELWSNSPVRHPGASSRSISYMKFRSQLPIHRLPIPDAVRRLGTRLLKKGKKAEIKCSEENLQAISALYSEGNRLLQSEFGVDVHALGYPTQVTES